MWICREALWDLNVECLPLGCICQILGACLLLAGDRSPLPISLPSMVFCSSVARAYLGAMVTTATYTYIPRYSIVPRGNHGNVMHMHTWVV